MLRASTLITPLQFVIIRIEERIIRHSFEVKRSYLHLMRISIATAIGQQLTNEEGLAIFDTVYPSWYLKRATHMHVIVHVSASLINMGSAIYTKGDHVHIPVRSTSMIHSLMPKLPPSNLVTIR